MDLVMQASSGLLSITGTAGGESVRCGYGVTDVTAGLFALIGILLALRAREVTGEGQYVDVSMLDAMISTMTSNFMSYFGSGELPRPMGTSFPTVVPYRVFGTRDRAIAIAVGSDKLWSAFCRAIGRPALATHPDYATNGLRVAHRAALEPLLAGVFARRGAAVWLRRLHAAGIPCSVVRDFREVVADPQCALREMFPVLPHGAAGPHTVTGAPVKLSLTPARISAPAPLLGEHTRATLRDQLGLDDNALAVLVSRGVLLTPA
jgi:crotonobetainyl-CoA:carnitine CoA-transferase CaiB-like acyl-CoA transferase